MPSLQNMMVNVRGRLGEPHAQHPSNHQVLLALSTHIQRYCNRLNLTGRPWAVDECSLLAVAGQEDYPVTATNFGRPIQVRTVYPANPSHIERDIDFFELGDVNFDWPFPRDFGALSFNPDGSPHTAQRMAFFRRGGQNQCYVRLIPIPQQSAQYQILYTVGVLGDTALATVPVLPEHHALIEIRTAISLLPQTQWVDDNRANSDTRREYAAALKNDEVELTRDFELYISSTSGNRRMSARIVEGID